MGHAPGWISREVGGGMWFESRRNPLNFDGDMRERILSLISHEGNNSWVLIKTNQAC